MCKKKTDHDILHYCQMSQKAYTCMHDLNKVILNDEFIYITQRKSQVQRDTSNLC